jgi:hypothetical protein
MSVASKRAIRNILLSLSFLLALAVVSILAQDRSLVAVAVVFAFVLGLPGLLLSIADLGRALKIEHGGNYRATGTTRLLSHYRAAGGAICTSAALYTLFRNIQALLNGTSAQPVMFQLLLVLGGLAWAVLGVLLIVRAFAKESGGPSGT